MKQEICIKVADEISNKLIQVDSKNKSSNKTILELFDELLEPQYEKYRCDILTYIPKQLAVKGYEIVNSDYFKLKKY